MDAAQTPQGMAFGLYDETIDALVLNLTLLDGSTGQVAIINPEGLIESIERARRAQLSAEIQNAPLRKPQPASCRVDGWEV